jgi:hypothetical protein
MSHFSSVKSQIKDLECLLEALKDLGYKPQVYEDPTRLRGYRNDLREQRAHVVVPKEQISRLSNDLGFYREADGTYSMVISDYDQAGPLKTFKEQIHVNYATKKVEKLVSKDSRFKIVNRSTEEDRLVITLEANATTGGRGDAQSRTRKLR